MNESKLDPLSQDSAEKWRESQHQKFLKEDAAATKVDHDPGGMQKATEALQEQRRRESLVTNKSARTPAELGQVTIPPLGKEVDPGVD